MQACTAQTLRVCKMCAAPSCAMHIYATRTGGFSFFPYDRGSGYDNCPRELWHILSLRKGLNCNQAWKKTQFPWNMVKIMIKNGRTGGFSFFPYDRGSGYDNCPRELWHILSLRKGLNCNQAWKKTQFPWNMVKIMIKNGVLF